MIQLASARPTPPPCEKPAMTAQADQKLVIPRTGPTSGLPSGEKVKGPLMIFLMPALLKAGKWRKPTSSSLVMRSRSSARSSWPKVHGVSIGDHGRQSFS
ncbi:hypothetical protein D3C87_1999380 [compost metagenome]